METFGHSKKYAYLCIAIKKRALSSAGLEHLPYKQRVGGSNPSAPTIGFQSFGIRFSFFLLPVASY